MLKNWLCPAVIGILGVVLVKLFLVSFYLITTVETKCLNDVVYYRSMFDLEPGFNRDGSFIECSAKEKTIEK